MAAGAAAAALEPAGLGAAVAAGFCADAGEARMNRDKAGARPARHRRFIVFLPEA